MRLKITPGKWLCEENTMLIGIRAFLPDKSLAVVWKPQHYEEAIVGGVYKRPYDTAGYPEYKANALAISRVPEMLALLVELVEPGDRRHDRIIASEFPDKASALLEGVVEE